MRLSNWIVIVESLFLEDYHPYGPYGNKSILPGVDVEEFVIRAVNGGGFDSVDQIYIDAETIGG